MGGAGEVGYFGDFDGDGDGDGDGGGGPVVGGVSLSDPLWSLTNLNGQHLALDHFDVLLCDCVAHALIVDEHDNPINLGLSARFASPAQRRTVLIVSMDTRPWSHSHLRMLNCDFI